MGMPVITPGSETRDQAVTDLIQSVALEEAAIAHILNAEGEKMQALIGRFETAPERMLELNDSVQQMVSAVTRLEMMLHAKLEFFSSEFRSK